MTVVSVHKIQCGRCTATSSGFLNPLLLIPVALAIAYAAMRKALTFRHQKRTKQLGLARGMFVAMDTDGSGEISRVELRQNLSVLGLDLSAETTFDIVEQIDVDHNGEISEQEFVAWMESNVSQLKMGLVVCTQRVDSQRCNVFLAIAC